MSVNSINKWFFIADNVHECLCDRCLCSDSSTSRSGPFSKVRNDLCAHIVGCAIFRSFDRCWSFDRVWGFSGVKNSFKKIFLDYNLFFQPSDNNPNDPVFWFFCQLFGDSKLSSLAWVEFWWAYLLFRYFFSSVTYVSYVRYGFEGAMISVYGFSREKLECHEVFCQFKRPDKFLKEMSMSDANYWLDVAALAGIFICLRIIAYFVLRWRIHSIR